MACGSGMQLGSVQLGSGMRIDLSYVLVQRKGYRLKEVAAQLGRDEATLSGLLSRFADRLQRDSLLQRALARVEQTVQI